MKDVSQFRQDPVSGEWVIIATGRGRRPDDFRNEKRLESVTPIISCPFENPEKSGHEVVYEVTGDSSTGSGQAWWIKVIKNKYPLVEGDKCGLTIDVGPYKVQPGAGHHEVVITRDHRRSIGQMTAEEVEKIVDTYQNRYKKLASLDCAHYILIFHNHGSEAGASLSHPHSQIAAVPMIPPDVGRSLEGSRRYWAKNNRCVHCDMIDWDRKENRVVFENETMVVVSPYAPRTAFEVRIYPKTHKPYFEDCATGEYRDLAEALRTALGKLFRGLNDVAYNFFIHTAPVFQKNDYKYYHWHIEILPKPPTPPAGFEFGTHVNVSVVNPNDAAEYLRGVSIKDLNKRQ